MKCPGQDTRYWKPGDIFDTGCPHCGSKVEFFKDEATRRCRSCRKTVVNPRMDFGCAAYCKYAADCLGGLGPSCSQSAVNIGKKGISPEQVEDLRGSFSMHRLRQQEETDENTEKDHRDR